MNKQFPKIATYLIALLLVLFCETGYSQHMFCRQMADNALLTYMSTDHDAKSNTFRFTCTRDISFYYNDRLIVLQAKAYSDPFPGKGPQSLTNCNVRIEDIPIDVYYTVIDFDPVYQSAATEITTILFSIHRSPDEYKRAIKLCEDNLAEIQENKRKVPDWFTDIWQYDQKISQTNTWLKNAQDYLGRANKTAADKQAQPNAGSESAKEEASPGNFWSDSGGSARDAGDPGQDSGGSAQGSGGANEVPEQSSPETMSDEEVRQLVQDNIDADMQEQQAFEDRLTGKVNGLIESFYQARAAGASFENIKNLSQLRGTYGSVEELEREFSRQYSMIGQEADNYAQAKTAAASTYINSATNTAQEAAYGEGLKAVSGIIAQAQAAKAEREAREELRREREAQLKAMEALRLKTIINARMALMEAFPNGGTPLSSHKVTLPEVYIFAYAADKALWNTGGPANVSVSNVFPVHRYADGTYPYKTTLLNMLRGYAAGEMTIVGYYTQAEMAEKMRAAFLSFADKSKLTVTQFQITDKKPSGSQTNTGGFWETGKEKKPSAGEKKEETSSGFWDN